MEVDGASLGSEGSTCGSNDDDEVRDDVDEAGEADRRVRRSAEGSLSISAILLSGVGRWTLERDQ